MTRRFAIMRIPGPAACARRRYTSPRPKRVDTFDVSGNDKLALAVYALRKYSGAHRQYQGHRFVWIGERGSLSANRVWKADDGRDVKGRHWRMLVTLANGASVHEVAYEAWS